MQWTNIRKGFQKQSGLDWNKNDNQTSFKNITKKEKLGKKSVLKGL